MRRDRSIGRGAGAVTLGMLMATMAMPGSAEAQWGAELRGQMGIGGDELASVQYSDGSESSLKMGTYFAFSLGPILEVWSSARHAVELQGMVGWATWSTGPDNTEDRLTLSRFPLDLLAFYGYRLPARDMMLRFGGGVTYHLIGGVGGSGSLDAVDVGIENSLGFTAETTLIFGVISTGVRYTQMDNTIDGVPGSVNGSSVDRKSVV